MDRIKEINDLAYKVEDKILEGIASGYLGPDYQMNINYDDGEIDAYAKVIRPINWIRCNVVVKKDLSR